MRRPWPAVWPADRVEARSRTVGLSQKRVKRQPILGGLINEYQRAA